MVLASVLQVILYVVLGPVINQTNVHVIKGVMKDTMIKIQGIVVRVQVRVLVLLSVVIQKNCLNKSVGFQKQIIQTHQILPR